MLNPGYTVIAKKEKIKGNPGRVFICPECKKVFLEVEVEPGTFRTKCSNCRKWVYGKKMLTKVLENG